MSSTGYFTRLCAALVVAAVMGASIANPQIGRKTAERSALAKIERLSADERACAPGEAPLTGGFASLDSVLSMTPLGAAAAPGEAPPAPYLRVTARQGAIAALAAGKGEIVAIERRVEHQRTLWTARFKPCDRITLFYDGLEKIDPALLRRAGGLGAFEKIGATRSAVAVRLKLDAGDAIGAASSFDIGLIDDAAPSALHADASHARTALALSSASDLSPALSRALALDEAHARCVFDYLSSDIRAAWSQKLGDGAGRRLPPGDSLCIAKAKGAPAGIAGDWFTDSSHNARASKLSAVTLSADLVDPTRLVFSLHGRLASLHRGAMAPDGEIGSVLTAESLGGRLNAPFSAVAPGETYCYEDLDLGFDGPALNGVLLMRYDPPLLKMEARADVAECVALDEPWRFTGDETSFYR